MAQLLVNIDVDDLPRAIDFYPRAFELTVARRIDDDFVELAGAGTLLYLLARPGGSDATPDGTARRDYHRHWTPLHLDFVVDDLPGAIDRALAAGAVPEAPMRTERWGRIAGFADPFGHGFCLLQFLDRGYDELRSSRDADAQ